MIKDKLYELAFEYKKTKLWKKITDTHIFAVKLSDGNTGYISVAGMTGEECLLALYIGDDAFNGWRNLFYDIDVLYDNPFIMEDYMFSQDCLQCEFTSKDMLSEEEYTEARAYARQNGIRVSGANAYPKFEKYMPECFPWKLQNKKDIENLCDALSAAIEAARLIEDSESSFVLEQMHDKTEYIPLFELKDDMYMVGSTTIPEYKPYEYPEPELNDIYTARLKKAKKGADWECEILRIPEPVQDKTGDAPLSLMTLIALEVNSEGICPIAPVKYYTENSLELLDQFAGFCLERGIRPRCIKVRDERTYLFFKSFCKRLNIPLSISKDLEVLDRAIEEFGDEWAFLCKVLRIEEKITDKPIVIRSKGDAPAQY